MKEQSGNFSFLCNLYWFALLAILFYSDGHPTCRLDDHYHSISVAQRLHKLVVVFIVLFAFDLDFINREVLAR